MKKSKISTILIIVATVILAGVAIFTATKLYNLRDQAVAPNVPTSEPAAMANPPIPAVSVITLSPISRHASDSVNPGKYSAFTIGD